MEQLFSFYEQQIQTRTENNEGFLQKYIHSCFKKLGGLKERGCS